MVFDLQKVLEDLGCIVCDVEACPEEAFGIANRAGADRAAMVVAVKIELDEMESSRRFHFEFGIPTAFLSGYPRAQEKKVARDVDPVAFFLEPIDVQELEKTLRDLTNEGPTS